MNPNNYTSLALSKKLKDCGLESEYMWEQWNRHGGKKGWELSLSEMTLKDEVTYPAFDILNDICVKYAKEFFGRDKTYFAVIGESGGYEADDVYLNWKEGDDNFEEDYLDELDDYQYHTTEILRLLQRGKKQEAEHYILEHCLFDTPIE